VIMIEDPYIKCETCKYSRTNNQRLYSLWNCAINKEMICGNMRRRIINTYPFWKCNNTIGSTSDSSFSSSSTTMDNDFIKKEEMQL